MCAGMCVRAHSTSIHVGKLVSWFSARCAHVALRQDSHMEVVGSLQGPQRSSATPPGAASKRGEARVDAEETPVLGNDLPREVCVSRAPGGAGWTSGAPGKGHQG